VGIFVEITAVKFCCVDDTLRRSAAMLAHFEVLVHVEKFRNLDLFHQGAYSVAARIYGQSSRRAARPVEFLCRPTDGSGDDAPKNAFCADQSGTDSGAGNTGGINDDDNSFRTTSFYVRYREEQHQVLPRC
jgi:hypothetical protein